MRTSTTQRRARRLVLALAATAAAFGTSSAVAAANTAVQGDPSVAALPGAAPHGTTPASTPETVSFILRAQDLAQLQSNTEQGVQSDLSVRQFAATYGQTDANVQALQSYLAGYKISTDAYADRLDVVATGTAGEFNRALGTSQEQYSVPQLHGAPHTMPVPAQTVHDATGAPKLPPQIASYVLAVLGLSNYGPFTSQAVHADVGSPPAPASAPSSGPSSSPSNCQLLTGLPDACNTPADFAQNYNLNGLYKAGASGQGQTLAIVTLAAVDPGAPQYFWKNIAGLTPSGRTLSVDNIDGGPGVPSDASGTGETDLDLEQSGSIAPGADVIDYQAPNTDPGFADSFFSAASSDKAASVSTSWGESETVVSAAVASGAETPEYTAAFDEAFLELAAQGQSAFTSAGDAGAYDASADLGSTNLSIDTPADSPYITAAGGTTLPWSGTLTGPTGTTAPVSVGAQRAWGWDYLWQPMATVSGATLEATAESNVVGGGGGYSSFYPEPPYQYHVAGTTRFSAVPYLTPTDDQTVGGIVVPTAWTFNPTPATITGSGSTRALPDVSTDADPFSGYLLYEPSFAGANQAELQGGWGGTSFVAPQLNGSTAVIDSYLGHRVGFWNPLIYGFATGGGSPFTPLNTAGTSNDNIYYSGSPGTDYNPATGLGIPDLTKLAGDFRRGSS
jgi:subtilase family serine protease